MMIIIIIRMMIKINDTNNDDDDSDDDDIYFFNSKLHLNLYIKNSLPKRQFWGGLSIKKDIIQKVSYCFGDAIFIQNPSQKPDLQNMLTHVGQSDNYICHCIG